MLLNRLNGSHNSIGLRVVGKKRVAERGRGNIQNKCQGYNKDKKYLYDRNQQPGKNTFCIFVSGLIFLQHRSQPLLYNL